MTLKDIYIQICLSILKNIDPSLGSKRKRFGRPNKYDYNFYIKHIINLTTLRDGLSWNNPKESSLSELDIQTDLIRKKYNKWVNLLLGLFTTVNKIVLAQYKKKNNSSSLFIDEDS